jgi:hypothetical protein
VLRRASRASAVLARELETVKATVAELAVPAPGVVTVACAL